MNHLEDTTPQEQFDFELRVERRERQRIEGIVREALDAFESNPMKGPKGYRSGFAESVSIVRKALREGGLDV